ncbi:dihydrofolate synthase / folylpolyglutamate synthase [Fodinibius roseus]|uniref:tetrahydrofolate synthase n=1 Tax=Fodinibius roseus TaxID=1194090 RepID=A0A1M4V9E8_9BACT|nr:Mur ligase family protein [Fodinibius roseus]SHE65621.1 dihydrofolate synthase / folylpolyglutamate synthase [Fodinibius roseus]
MPFLSIEDVEQYLAAIPKFQSDHTKATDFNLSKFEVFCKELGNPQNRFSSIHVAGTNGKGSTCRILAGVYRQAGYSVGCYTSPHMIQYNERFVINGRPIPDKALLLFFRQYHALIEVHKLTYFEISTAIAFWWFSKREVDLGIIETGLGGRLDATNIIRPLVSVITSISLDHTDILGDSLREIAQEKGGIIKSGRPVVLGNLPEEAESTVRRIAEGKESAVITIEPLRPVMMKAGDITLRVGGRNIRLKTTLQAPVQARNVAVAWQVIKAVNSHFRVSEEEFRSGIQHTAAGRGRFEKLLEKKRWYFDGAHNIEAVQGVKQSVSTVGEVDKAILVLSLMRDKISSEVMNEFSEFKNIYYYSLNTERAAPFKEIRRWWPQVMAFPTQPDQQKQLFKEFDSELVIFAGSFYFYTTVRDWIKTLV